MKHVGKMKNNSAKIVVAYRTLPGDAASALVVGTNGLADSYHDALMNLVESEAAQNANELAEVLAVRIFPDGSNMLGYLHSQGHLKKVPTKLVLMTPNAKTSVPLDELNQLIASQRGISVEDLAVSDGSTKVEKKSSTKPVIVEDSVSAEPVEEKPMTPAEMRSMANSLYKKAAQLRKTADELDPPVKKSRAAKALAE
jgi:hypothetical protein